MKISPKLIVTLSPKAFTILFVVAAAIVAMLGASIVALTILEKPVPPEFLKVFAPAFTGLIGLIVYPHNSDDSAEQ